MYNTSYMKKIIFIGLTSFLTLVSAAQTRVVLIEQFSNSSCGPCGAVSPSVYAFADMNASNTAVVAYHTSFPYYNDSMYFENPTESAQRVSYYSVSSVPYSVLDGNVYNGSTNPFVSAINTQVNNRLSVSPRYSIQALSVNLTGSQLSGSFKFTSTNASNASENLVAHLVIIEKNVLKSAYAASPGNNNETQYGYVMRKMIPNAGGSLLAQTALNAYDTIAFNWTLANIKDKLELRIVAFVQNMATKEIYQAQLFDFPKGPVGLSENEMDQARLSVYPNPLNGATELVISAPFFISGSRVFDVSGKLVIASEGNLIHTASLNPGIYFLSVNAERGIIRKKIIVN